MTAVDDEYALMDEVSTVPTDPDADAWRWPVDTYGDSFADVYDDWYGDVSDTEALADAVVARCGPGAILELGVGTGRVAAPLIARGRHVVGVDASAPMLARCRRSHPAVTVIRADMSMLPVRGPFAAVVVAFNTLFNLTSAAAQQRLFREASAVLAPDGVVVIEALGLGVAPDAPSRSFGVRRRDAQSMTLVACEVDHAGQRMTGRHIELGPGGVRLRPWALRWSTSAEIDEFAADAGLELTERTGQTAGTQVSWYRPGTSSAGVEGQRQP